jgi:hypothetical protein
MAAVDFRELDAIAADLFGDEAQYTPPTGGTPVTVHPVVSGGDGTDHGIGPVGVRAPLRRVALLVSEVPADPSPVEPLGEGPPLRARIVITSGPWAGESYAIAAASRAPTGGAWDCDLEAE